MSTSYQEHAKILEEDLDVLESTPQVVTPGHIANMHEHINQYRDERGSVDSLKAWLFALLITAAFGAAIASLGFAGAAILWALEGSHPWSLMVFPCVTGPAFVWLFVKLNKWMDTASAARWAAGHLKNELTPWRTHDWERAQIVRTLTTEADEYFAEITSTGEPLYFQLTALHRLANVLTVQDESSIDDGGWSRAPQGAVHLHMHPNWPGKVGTS